MGGAGGADAAHHARHWDDEFGVGRPWGDEPSVLGGAAARFLGEAVPDPSALRVLDLGCGEGRDARYLWRQLGCSVLGVDSSSPAIELAREGAHEDSALEFACRSFVGLRAGLFDVVCASNLYQILEPALRRELVETMRVSLAPGGYLMLATLAVGDPEHWARGEAVRNDANSFRDKVYLHFASADELMREFGFVERRELATAEYDEPRADGSVHHHLSWVLIGQRP
jgi:SAM-dependent methyltransferase